MIDLKETPFIHFGDLNARDWLKKIIEILFNYGGHTFSTFPAIKKLQIALQRCYNSAMPGACTGPSLCG